jgi:hypothetical protein
LLARHAQIQITPLAQVLVQHVEIAPQTHQFMLETEFQTQERPTLSPAVTQRLVPARGHAADAQAT